MLGAGRRVGGRQGNTLWVDFNGLILQPLENLQEGQVPGPSGHRAWDSDSDLGEWMRAVEAAPLAARGNPVGMRAPPWKNGCAVGKRNSKWQCDKETMSPALGNKPKNDPAFTCTRRCRPGSGGSLGAVTQGSGSNRHVARDFTFAVLCIF